MIPSDSSTTPKYHVVPIHDGSQSARTSSIWVADSLGLRLNARPGGVLDADSFDGSLGRLVLPRGFAVDISLRCFFVQRSTESILMFDSAKVPHSNDTPFVRIVDFKAGSSMDTVHAPSARLNRQWSIAASPSTLFVICPNRCDVVGLSLETWATQVMQRFADGETPIDVVAGTQVVYCLTNLAIYRFSVDQGRWIECTPLTSDGLIERLLLDRDESLVAHSSKLGFLRFDPKKGQWNSISIDRTSFPVPPVYALSPHKRIDDEASRGDAELAPRQFVIPPELASVCNRRIPMIRHEIPPELGAIAVTPAMQSGDLSHGFVISETGQRNRTPPYQMPRTRSLMTGIEWTSNPNEAYWISPRIDSHRYRCPWDRIDIEMSLPLGTQVEFATYTSDDASENAPEGNSAQWDVGASFVDESNEKGVHHASPPSLDFLVRSRPGQFIWVRARLRGDGFVTPLIHRLFTKSPRLPYTEFLPAVMIEDDMSRDFLERFLAVVQTGWDEIDQKIDTIDRLFQPASAPADQLTALALRLGLPQFPDWHDGQVRQFLNGVPNLLSAPPDLDEGIEQGTIRGTPRYLKDYLQALLSALTGLNPDEMGGFPWIIEGYREREAQPLGGRQSHYQMMGTSIGPSSTSVLAGGSNHNRFQLGDRSVLGEQQLLPPGAPGLDLYESYAHRFRVVVPEPWLRSSGAKTSMESAIESEKPAHTLGTLDLVRPGFCVGLQSTIGIDTILSERPKLILSRDPPSPLGLGQSILPGSFDPLTTPMKVDQPIDQHRI